MLIGLLDQFDSTQLLIGLGVFFIAQMVFFKYMFGRLNSDPSDPLDSAGRESEILGDQPVRSKVGTPRPRRLQPVAKTAGSELAGGRAVVEPETASAVAPVKEISVGKAEVPSEKKPDPYAPLPLTASEKPAAGPLEAVLEPVLASLSKPEHVSDKPSADLVPIAAAKTPEPIAAAAEKISLPPISLPPLAAEVPAASKEAPAFALVPLKPGASLVPPVGSKEPEEGAKPVPAAPIPEDVLPVAPTPRRFFANPFAKPAAPAEGKIESKPEEKAPLAPVSGSLEPVLAVPAIAAAGEGIIAVSGPTPLETSAKPAEAADADESDDVKKRKTPKTATSAPERSGLILIPPVTAAAGAKTVPADQPVEGSVPLEAKVGPPAGALTLAPTPEAKKEATPLPPAPAPTKLVGRPRIFLPTDAPAASAPKEEVAAEKPADEPAVPAEVVKAKEETASAPEVEPAAAPEVAAESASIEAPADIEAKDAALPAEVKPEETPLSGVLEPEAEKSVEEPAKPAEDEKAEKPSAAFAEPEPEPIVPVTADLIEEKAPASEPVPEAAKTEEESLPPEAFTPVPVPTLPKSAPAPATPPEGALSLASIPPAHSLTTPQPVMPSNESTNSSSATGRASAQLTLGFEITSLQLTPFFKLGAVQLRPLSNIVSLHLIGAQPENPLAAGISFQIDKVELDGSHIKTIHLKLLGGAQDAATPQPKLQVNSVELSQGSQGAPISITPSDQTSTAVQLLATFTIAAMDFTPSFEIGSLRLEPTSNQVMLRLAPSSRPAALDLPPAFDVSSVQLGSDSQISAVALTPTATK